MSEYDILATALTDQSHVVFLEGLSDQGFWRYATELASATPTTKLEIGQYLECELEQKRCILPLAVLREVVAPPHQITLLPSIPAWMPGITAWRGETIATVDLEAYLTQCPARLCSDSVLLVIQQDEITGLVCCCCEVNTSARSGTILPSRASDSRVFPSFCGSDLRHLRRCLGV